MLLTIQPKINALITQAHKRGWHVDMDDYARTGKGKIGFVVSLHDKHGMLFYTPETDKFSGLWADGMRFDSSDVRLRGYQWFDTLINFFTRRYVMRDYKNPIKSDLPPPRWQRLIFGGGLIAVNIVLLVTIVHMMR